MLTGDVEGRGEVVLPLHFFSICYPPDMKARGSVNTLVEINLFQNADANFRMKTPKMNDFDHVCFAVSPNSLRR